MNILELQKRAIPLSEPLYRGEWGLFAFRPDLSSQQEFIVGAVAAIRGDASPHLKWLPNWSKLSQLYGDALSSNDVAALISGSEYAIQSEFKSNFPIHLNTGTPHLRLIPCGYFATHDVDKELTVLLRRQANAIWHEAPAKEDVMNDDWAYQMMRQSLEQMKNNARNIFASKREVVIGNKSFKVGIDTGKRYGNIVSARYASFHTIERHVYESVIALNSVQRLSKREEPCAIFLIFPENGGSSEITKKTIELLGRVEDNGVTPYHSSQVEELAAKLSVWADES